MAALAIAAGIVCFIACSATPKQTPVPSSTPTMLAPAPSSIPKDAVPFHPAPPPVVAWPTARWDASCGACNTAIAREACERCGGVWDAGMAGVGSCSCPVDDAGKPCRDERDCKTYCALTWVDALAHGGTKCNDDFCMGPGAKTGLPWGACKTHQTSYGCQGWIETFSSPYGVMRKTKWICRD